MIPKTDFITTLLNIEDSDLEYFFVSSEDDKMFYNLCLKRMPIPCPYCHCSTIG